MSLPGFLGAAGLEKLMASPVGGRRSNGSTASAGLETTEEVSEGSTNPSPIVPSSSFLNGSALDHPSPLPVELSIVVVEDETEEETVHERIERELNELEEVERTGVRFLRAEQGMRIGESRETCAPRLRELTDPLFLLTAF